MNGCCQTQPETKTSIISKITNFAAANSIKFSKIHSSRGRILGHATTLARRDVGSLTNTTRSPGRGIFVFSLSANGAFLLKISSALSQTEQESGILIVNLDLELDEDESPFLFAFSVDLLLFDKTQNLFPPKILSTEHNHMPYFALKLKDRENM